MKYKQEVAAVRMAVKRTLRSGNPETGFSSLKKFIDNNPNYDAEFIAKCFKKWLKRRFYNL